MDSQPTTSQSPLLQWVQPQPAWIKHIVRDVLNGTTTLDNLRIDHYRDLLLSECGLGATPVTAPPELAEPTPHTGRQPKLLLQKLTILAGVNRLSPGTTVDFAEGLTVIFGANGSGKSGFARVLKRMAAARTNDRILGDIGVDTPPVPSATLTLSLDGASRTLSWNDELGIEPVTAVSVFDTPTSRVHLEGDLAYKYTPETLGFYKVIREALAAVRARLISEATAKAPDLAQFAGLFTPGTSIHNAVIALSSTTNLEPLQKIAFLGPLEHARLKEINAEIAALMSASVESDLKLVGHRVTILDGIQPVFQVAQRFDRQAFERLLKELAAAEAEEHKTTSQAFGGLGIPGALSDEWKRFIEAGHTYTIAHEHVDRICVYCRQDLGPAALGLIAKYEQLVTGAARKERERVEAQLRSTCDALHQVDVDRLTNAIESEIGGDRGHAWHPLLTALHHCQALRASAISRISIEWSQEAKEVEIARRQLTSEAEALRTRTRDLMSTQEQRVARLASLGAERSTLRDRAVLVDNLARIIVAVTAANWSSRVHDTLAPVTGILGNLTNASTDHGNALINTDFQARFEAECITLRAPTGITLDFPGREAQSKRTKGVAKNVPLINVFSEGEQNAVAMADFIAEAGILDKDGPLIFDDPVNSLDYLRLTLVARRLQDLARERQVIVFTHNVWFVAELLNLRREKDRARTMYWNMDTSESGSGRITPGSHPRIDSWGNLTKRLNEVIARAQGETGDVQLESLKKGYGLLRSAIEIAIEKDLLKSTTQRYQPNVSVDSLQDIKVSELPASIDVLGDIYETACRMLDGHSQPLEQSNVQPTLEQLKMDQAAVKAERDKHKAE